MEQNKNTITEQDIFVGATVIRADGLKGKITRLGFDPWESNILFENGATFCVDFDDERDLADFYFIGHTILGNRVATEQIEERISALAIERNKFNEQIDQLRKQLYRLCNTMDGRPMSEIMAEQKAKKGKKGGGNNDNNT